MTYKKLAFLAAVTLIGAVLIASPAQARFGGGGHGGGWHGGRAWRWLARWLCSRSRFRGASGIRRPTVRPSRILSTPPFRRAVHRCRHCRRWILVVLDLGSNSVRLATRLGVWLGLTLGLRLRVLSTQRRGAIE